MTIPHVPYTGKDDSFEVAVMQSLYKSPDVLDEFDNNATASFMLNDHHDVVGTPDKEGVIDYCERCLFAVGWVQPTSLGPDEYGHSTAASSDEVRAWIEAQS